MRWCRGPWDVEPLRLERMGWRELVVAFFTWYSIQVYLLLAVLGLALAFLWTESPARTLAVALLVVVLYPFVEYAIHRFVLHGPLYRLPALAKVWKRIHYDHHRDPNDLKVLFGALYTVLPTIAVITLPLGWAVDGPAGAAMAFATGCLVFTFYEFCHCVQHLPVKPKNRWLRAIKRRHLAHHFHNEQGNFGITGNLVDRLVGTFYDPPGTWPRSPTARNLGYAGEERRRYPWVARLSGEVPEDPPAAGEGRA